MGQLWIPEVLRKIQPAMFLLSLSLVLGRSVGKEIPEGCIDAACTTCQPCFTGDACATKTLTIKESIILDLAAQNPSEELFSNTEDACKSLKYDFKFKTPDEQDAGSVFQVDKGKVQLADPKKVPAAVSYTVDVTVHLPDASPAEKPYASRKDVSIQIMRPPTADEDVKSRQRRAANAPGNVTFAMKRTFPVQNITYMTYGQRISFEVTIAFPNRETDMSVELFAPDNQTEVMMLCNWDITVGDQLNINRDDVLNKAVAEGRGSSKWPFTRVVLKLGNVTLKSASGANDASFQVKITFDSIMIKTSVSVANDSKHWVSAGAEFNNEKEIWIGSAMFTAVTDADTTTYNPNVNFIGPTSVEPGKTNEYKLDLYLPQRFISPMTLDIIAPINNTEIISMCTAYITATEESYKCIQKDKVSVASKKYPYHQNYYKVSLDFGMVVNKESFNAARPNTSDHIFVTFFMRVNRSSTVGTPTYIGAGVQMGSTIIWSGAKSLTVGAVTKLVNLTNNAIVNYTHSSSGPLSKYQLSYSDITIETPMNSTTDVTVSIISPTTGTMIPRFHLCRISATFVGANYPCAKYLIGTNEMPIVHKSTQTTASFVTDHLTLSMPALRNTGLFTKNSTDNKMIFRVFYTPSNNTDNVLGKSAPIDFKVVWGGGQSTDQKTISFANDVNVSNLPNSSLPTFTFVTDGSVGSTVGYLEGRVMKLSVVVKPTQMYTPATIELVLPYTAGTGAPYTVCTAEILSIGKALPCLRKTSINPSISYTSKANDTTKNDRAVVPLGAVCSYEDSTFTADDYTFVIVFRIYHQAIGANGANNWISTGMLISLTQLWVGQVKLLTSTTATGDNTPPTIHLVRKDSPSNTIYKLDAARLRLIVKIPVAKKPVITINLSTNSTTGKLSICEMAVVSRGKCISCTGDNVTYTNFNNDRFNRERAVLPLGKVLNTNCSAGAFYTHAGEDENSIVMEIVVKTNNEIATKTSVVADVNYGSGSVKAGYHFDVTASPPPNGTATKPTYKTSTVNLFNENVTEVITNGEAVRFYLDVILAPHVKHYLDVNVGNRLGANILDIANVNVHSSGKNVPCLVPGYPEANYSRRTGSPQQDFGQILIGTCLNTGQHESTDENNRIRLEVIVRVWKSISKTGSTQVYSLAFLNQDYAQLTDGQVNYTTGQNITTYIQDASITMNATVNLTDISVRPGSTFKVPVVVEVPPYTQYQRFLVDYKATDVAGTDSVSVTGINMTFTFCGANLALFCNEPYPVDNSSSRNSSQKDRMIVDLGILQNTAVTYRLNQIEASNPNAFVVEYELQLTDNQAGYNGTNFWLSFGISNGNQIVLVNKTVTIVRDGKETPVLNFSLALENATSPLIYQAGMDIPLTALLSHYNTSSQEPRNCWVNLLYPTYLNVKNVVEPIGYIGTMNHSKIANGHYRFDFPWLFFTDYITMNFSMEVIAGSVIPGNRIEAVSSVIAEFVFDVFNRTDNPNNYKWLRNATQVSFKARGSPPTISSCNSNLNIHLTTEVQDCAISAFMSPFPTNPPNQVRSSTGWRSHVRSGQYAAHRYVTILFGKLKYVTTINLFSSTATGVSKATEIAVYKTMDGRAFTKVVQRAVVWDTNNNATFSLGKKVLLRGIRVAATKADNEDNTVSMHLEMFGCPHTDTSVHFNPCTTKEYDALPTTPAVGHYLRGYLHVTGKFLFYCDYIPKKDTNFEIYSRCFKALDSAPTTWTDLGPLVGSVIGYNEHGVAYAVTPDGMSYSMSQDHGDTWFAVNKGKYDNDLAKGMMKNATQIPWLTKTGFTANLKGEGCSAFASKPWNFCYDGIFHNNGSAPVVRWNDCC